MDIQSTSSSVQKGEVGPNTMTSENRSNLMRMIRSKDTNPEMLIRHILYAMGVRYRLHVSGLPGKPDIVLTRKRKVIFVHGCFWHGHDCPAGRNIPKSNVRYWHPKLARNVARDNENKRALEELGWSLLILWECELKDLTKVSEQLNAFLNAK